MAAFAYLTCFKRIYEKICSKKYCFVKQGLCKLKAEEAKVAKMGSNPTVVETAYTLVVESLSPAVHLLPLADLFEFGFSFSLLPDLLFYNIF